MTVTDGLFNFPPLPFIYVHDIVVVRTSVAEYTADENGQTVPQLVPQVRVKGYATSPGTYLVGEFSDRIDAIVLIPHDLVVVDLRDKIYIPQQNNILPILLGEYIVSEAGLRPNPLHQRIFVKRGSGEPFFNRDNPYVAPAPL